MPKTGFSKSLVYAVFLIWLALTGSYTAWQVRLFLAINGYLSVGILIYAGWHISIHGPKPLTKPLFVFWSFGALVSALSGNVAAIPRIYFWSIMIAVYHLPHDLGALRQGARWAAWLILPLSIVWPWENGNSMAMLIWGLYWLALVTPGESWPALSVTNLALSILAGIALLSTRSEGGLLAVLVGVSAWYWLQSSQDQRTWLAGALLYVLAVAGLLTIIFKIDDANSFGARLDVYQSAWAGFTQSPIWGHGYAAFEATARTGWGTKEQHNLLLTILYEGGLIGLGLAGWLVQRLVSRHQLDAYTVAWLVTFMAHSLVDGPLFASFFTAVTLFMILGALPCREKITWGWLSPAAWPWPWPARRARQV